MPDPLNLGAMMVSGAPLARTTTAATTNPYGPYPDPFATGVLNPAYRSGKGVNVGYDAQGNLIDTATGDLLNVWGFNNPYDTYKANIPSWMPGVAASSGMPGAYSISSDYQEALDKLKPAEYEMKLFQNSPKLWLRAGAGQEYLNVYENLRPLQVQRDVAEGRTTPAQAQAWLMLEGIPGQVGGGFADQLKDWERAVAKDKENLAGLEAELAGYGEDPRYAIQRAAVVDRINTQKSTLIPRREQTLREMQETVGQYTPALGTYSPALEDAPYKALAEGMIATRDRAEAARQAQRKALEDANRAAEEASAAYKFGKVEGWNEEENARRFAANIASRNALTDFIAANRKPLAKGGLAVKKFWDKPRPEGQKPKTLSAKKKASAKRRAKAAGRPYPNLVDNAFAARKKGK